MKKPKARLGRIRTTEGGDLYARCSCGWSFQASTEDLVVACWGGHVHREAWLHRPLKSAPPAVPATCTHWQAVAVRESMTEDIVAWLCPDCDIQLAERPPLARPPSPPFAPDLQLTGRSGA